MGLDITAYRNMTKADGLTVDDDYEVVGADGEVIEHYWDRYVVIDTEESEKNWAGRTAPLEDKTVYAFAEEFDFRAGSYMGYNHWRNHLAKMAGYASDEQVFNLPPHVSGAFIEHISFTDCDGVIGSVTSAKLAKDYAAFQSQAEKYAQTLDGDWVEFFIRAYNNWRKAFEIAAENGAVRFH
jgi:hypothetical protein